MERFTGSYGLILEPDEETSRAAIQLGSMAHKSLYQVEKPHVTLHLANVKNLEENAVMEALKRIAHSLNGALPIPTAGINIFAEKFLFWDLARTPLLENAHELALKCFQRKLQSAAAQQSAQRETLALSDKETDNLKRYGYPFVKESYKPHITLAFSEPHIVLPIEARNHLPKQATITRVSFTEVGAFGSIRSTLRSVSLNSL